jgi:hypothetical protein
MRPGDNREGGASATSDPSRLPLGPPFDGRDGCAWCGAPAIGTVLIRPPDNHGRITSIISERRVPVCAVHRDQLELAGDRHTADAQRRVSTRQWRAKQARLFDDLAFKTYGVQRGWWE